MNIKIDLNITLPDGLVAALAALSGGVNAASAPAPKASKAKAEPAAAASVNAPPADAPATALSDPQLEPAATLPPVNVTDEMIVAAADAAVVKVGSNPMIIKSAIAARFQKDDGSPASLKTVSAAQRPAMHAFLVAVGQTGDVNGTV